jgi:DNA transposition AAA+ family ATPase
MSEDQESESIHKVDVPRATWSFGGDHVMRVTKDLPEADRDALRWLFFNAVEMRLSLAEVSEKIGYDKSVVWKVFNGKYEGSLANIVKAIHRYRRDLEQHALIVRSDLAQNFVETSTARKIWKYCDLAGQYHTFSFIYGESQVGKTWALEKYALDHNHGRTRYMRLSACGGVHLLMKDMATACALSRRSCFEHLRERVFAATDENTTWILDEMHQALVSYHKHARIGCFELVRELQDRTGCSVVLSMTPYGREEIETGDHARLLQQLRRRGVFVLQLPPFATKADLDAIAKHYGLPPAEDTAGELVRDLVHSSGLKAYTTFLRAAGKVAENRKEKLAWSHFVDAHDMIQKLSEGGRK